MSALRVGVIGLGVISKFYLAAVERLPGVELTAVCDLREDALSGFRGRVGTYHDHRRLLARDDVDAVIVNVPNDSHGEICRDALRAGRAVCVEKPLTNDVAEARELTELATEQSRTLFTAFHRRYNDNIRALRDRLAAAPPVTALTVRYLELIEDHVGADGWYLDPARCGGGCVADNGPNAFDVARELAGDLTVGSAEVVYDADGVDRQATIQLTGAAGIPVRIELDWSYPYGEGKDVEVELAGGGRDGADMLDGHPEFKGSLWHEYEGVLADFLASVRTGVNRSPHGLPMLELVHQAYRLAGAGTTRTETTA